MESLTHSRLEPVGWPSLGLEMPLRVLLNGARGRMGQTITSLAQELEFEIVSAVDLGDDPSKGMSNCDVAIDFSSHDSAIPLVKVTTREKKAMVIGTTGHTEEESDAIVEASESLPIVWAGNYSIGVNLLFYLTERAASILNRSYNPEVTELHHRFKVDAPSGTAEGLRKAIAEARSLDKSKTRYGREGITGERPEDEIGMHSLRGGDAVGDHTVYFVGDGERIELTHRASDRKIYAQGAISAAKWVVDQPPGLYSMRDVLGMGE